MRWRIDLEYDGSDFAGWQVQRGARTVQGVIAQAAERLLGHPTVISGAGRTDSGVHAKQQVASFTTEVERTAHSVVYGLNAFLPPDVACTAAQRVADTFDPRRNPHSKRYVYSFCDRPTRSPLLRGRAWHVRHRLDAEAMDLACRTLVGTHDFSSFRATGCASTHPIRTIEHAEAIRDGDRVRLALHGTGFLRHMVRIIAGCANEIGRGAQDPSWLAQVREAHDREAGARTAPPHGLCLEWIRYAD